MNKFISPKAKEVLTRLYNKEKFERAEYKTELYYLEEIGLVKVIPAEDTIYDAHLTSEGEYSVKTGFQNFNQSSSSNYIHGDNNTIVCNNENIKNSFNTENNQWNDCFNEFMESDVDEEIKKLFEKLNNENQDMLKNMIEEIKNTPGEKNKISRFKEFLTKHATHATKFITDIVVGVAVNKISTIF